MDFLPFRAEVSFFVVCRNFIYKFWLFSFLVRKVRPIELQGMQNVDCSRVFQTRQIGTGNWSQEIHDPAYPNRAFSFQSPKFDGTIPNWYHFECFFQKQRPKSVDEIEFFGKLRYEDQEKVKSRIGGEASSSSAAKAPKKGKKRAAQETSTPFLKDFGVEYAASGRSTCKGCEIKILKDEVRVKKMDYDGDVGARLGGCPMWHHLDCFSKVIL